MPRFATKNEDDSAERERIRISFERKIGRLVDRCLKNLMVLADGVLVEVEDEDGAKKIYQKPPDRAANEYILNRLLGRPATRKSLVDPPPPVPTKIDLSRVPIERLETMERWLLEANGTGESVDSGQSNGVNLSGPPE